MDCLERIRYLLKERGWSVYRLAQEAGVPQSTLANLFCETTCPPSPRWSGFARPEHHLGEFFAEEPTQPSQGELTAQLLGEWEKLSPSQRQLVLELVRQLSRS